MKCLLILTEGDIYQGSARIRAIQYFPALSEHYKLAYFSRIKDKRSFSADNAFLKNIIFKLTKLTQFVSALFYTLFTPVDLIFIQRWHLPFLLRKVIALKKIKVIFDFDDAIYIGREKHFADMLALSSCIIVSTEELRTYCKKITDAPIHLIYSPVDTSVIKKYHPDNHIIKIGWIGSQTNVIYLEQIEAVFEKLVQNHQFELYIVGAKWNTQLKNVKPVEWTIENELAVLNFIDIGIMPLSNSELAKNKGGYKLFLYMAAGKPVVGSPTGINKDIVDDGINGYNATNHDEWYKYLALLIENKELRERLGDNGREKCVKLYSYEHNAPNLIRIINTFI